MIQYREICDNCQWIISVFPYTTLVASLIGMKITKMIFNDESGRIGEERK
jgi:hypothetical protein